MDEVLMRALGHYKYCVGKRVDQCSKNNNAYDDDDTYDYNQT